MADDGDKPTDPRPRIETRPTVQLDPTSLKPTWPIVNASLEQLGAAHNNVPLILALRLGVLTMINNCVRELAEPTASPALINRLRDLVEVLAHIPLER